MVRHRPRKTEKAKWDEEMLQRAFELVGQGRSVKSVARALDIPRSTLQDRLKANSAVKPPLGRKSTFTPDQEKVLTDHLKQLANTFYGITLTELRRVAFDLAETMNIKNNFSKEKKLAGEDWLKGFLKRNPTLSLRKPSPTSLNRVLAFNKDEVDLFYSNLEKIYEQRIFPATRIFNVDETGISTVQKPGKILATKGQRQVGFVTSWERGRNITVVCSVNAAGSFVPPMFIFPRKRMSPQLEKGGPAGAIYRCSHNGWINEELFVEWLHHFKDNVKPTEEDPVLLVMDNHYSHVTLESYEFCKAHHIQVVSIPPHTSHRLQPLDVSFYGPMKKAFNLECDRFLRTNRFQKISVYDIASIFNEAYMKMATMEKGVSAFRVAGILPFNPDKFSEVDFIPETSEHLVIEEHDVLAIELKNDDNIEENVNNFVKKTVKECRPADERKSGHIDDLYANPVPGGSGLCSFPKKQPEPKSTALDKFSTQLNKISPKIAVENVSKSKPLLKSGGCKKQHSIILTATPMKATLEEAKRKRMERETKIKIKQENVKSKSKGDKQKMLSKVKKEKGEKPIKPTKKSKSAAQLKKKKKTCRRHISFSDSSTEEEIDETKLCDDDEIDDTIDLFAEGTEMCLVCGEFGSSELWYRCTICGKWAHADCSGSDTPENYKCDYCFSE